ncbi:hypothetical protein QBC47DRAFT_375552 [Echria macrotheca]|uniref:N-acetyltransferase domain-containing protein n=1 Tax=Echria macrotheca TaxID=438768 RepID=A0AAJ0FEG1_9PEZI|nr:hypothetical protein QBC47DRAFT_375552 [Echria macrotheca]
MAQQPSIRAFFQPRQQPKYAAPPPSASASAPAAAPPPIVEVGSPTTPIPVPPPLPPLAEQPVPPIAAVIPTLPSLPSPPSLPPQAQIVPVAENHIAALRRINTLLLPVAYPDSFYAKALDPLASGLFSRAILWQDTPGDPPKVIGGVVCRLEPNNPSLDRLPAAPSSREPENIQGHAIYIQSLALLSPYRSQGLAAAALEHIIASASLLPATGSTIDVRTIYAHVWTENDEGLKWYAARGFHRVSDQPLAGYYFKLRPDTAWVVRRDIGPDALPAPAASGQWQAAWSSSSSSNPGSSIPLPGSSTTNSTLAAAVNLPSGGPRSGRPSATPSPSASTLSFQNARPETEWNDLPADMVAAPPTTTNGRLGPGGSNSAHGSAASSRSSSTVRKKRERAYPTAAFGK